MLVDAFCAVPDAPAVVAAGDVTAWPHPHADEPVSIEHWTNAGDMASVAAANLLRSHTERERFAPVPTFWSDQYDVTIKAAGLFGQADRRAIVDEETGGDLATGARGPPR